jgi:hypothetical protein
MVSERYFAIAVSLDAAKELDESNPALRMPIPGYYAGIPGIVELRSLEIAEDAPIRGLMAYIVGTTTKYPAYYRRIDHTCVTWTTWSARCSCRTKFNWSLSIELRQGINQYFLSIEYPIVSGFRRSTQQKVGELQDMTSWPLEAFIHHSALECPN